VTEACGGGQRDKVDVRLPSKGNSNSHGARPVHLIISMIKSGGGQRDKMRWTALHRAAGNGHGEVRGVGCRVQGVGCRVWGDRCRLQ